MKDKENVFDVLKKMGWEENRNVDKNAIITTVQSEGYPIFECVIDFLTKFIDTKIYFVNKRNGLQNDDIDFNFEKATHLEVPERINGEYSQRIGKSLCLIGSAYREYMVLMMDADGTVYGGYDNYLCKIATSGLNAINAIINDYDFEEVR